MINSIPLTYIWPELGIHIKNIILFNIRKHGQYTYDSEITKIMKYLKTKLIKTISYKLCIVETK